MYSREVSRTFFEHLDIAFYVKLILYYMRDLALSMPLGFSFSLRVGGNSSPRNFSLIFIPCYTQVYSPLTNENCYIMHLFSAMLKRSEALKDPMPGYLFPWLLLEQKQMIKTDLWANEFIAATWWNKIKYIEHQSKALPSPIVATYCTRGGRVDSEEIELCLWR